ncbi:MULTISPECIES: hypothetical protein [Paenibacillaceae]|uniref:hypothetical protein n=1 Tax=unclassified Paenibacillus TaxID=185978 RepID=UPI0011AA18E5|nr:MULTISPECIES: hypothetical protein [Paenibacillaceae]MBU5445604.1 hypothetical protein [Paenibacillus sp. MSJ-34]
MKNILLAFLMFFLFLAGCSSNTDPQKDDSQTVPPATPNPINNETEPQTPPVSSPESQPMEELNPLESQAPEDEQPSLPEDGSDLWERDKWDKMGMPNADIIGIVKEVDVQDGYLVSLTVEVEQQITDFGSIQEGDSLTILYYDELPDGFVPAVNDRIKTLLNHYITGAGRKIEWGGFTYDLCYEKDGKIVNVFGRVFVDKTFDEYVKSQKQPLSAAS